ncbi:MAG: major facilitator superfamily 1 [Acidimicrobiales bacterium]|jgi:ABC-type branched-subunit amino acid transport system ATPase component|nr:major facilitator superfamily 1 [Acidimicrobiales bacterium]
MPTGATGMGDPDEVVKGSAADTALAATANGAAPTGPDAAGAVILDVRGVDFGYSQVQVLFDVSLRVAPGEVLALLGTNGAGKSTLLRVISGLGRPSRGRVVFRGRDITDVAPEARVTLGIVQVAGGRGVFPSLPVRDNLIAGGFLLRHDQRELRRRIDEVLSLFPVLAQRIGQPAATLSGGERQMLALAMGLLLDPSVLLLDELSLGLAPVVVAELMAVVAGLKGRGVTMIVVEQSVNVALSMADRAIFLEKGEVRFEGRADDLLERDDLVRAVFLGQNGN